MEIEVLNKKNNYYELYHVYEDKALGDKVVKFIGLFSSTQNAWKAIKALRHQPGFACILKNVLNFLILYLLVIMNGKKVFVQLKKLSNIKKRIFRDDE